MLTDSACLDTACRSSPFTLLNYLSNELGMLSSRHAFPIWTKLSPVLVASRLIAQPLLMWLIWQKQKVERKGCWYIHAVPTRGKAQKGSGRSNDGYFGSKLVSVRIYDPNKTGGRVHKWCTAKLFYKNLHLWFSAQGLKVGNQWLTCHRSSILHFSTQMHVLTFLFDQMTLPT